MLTRKDFLPDGTADGDLFFPFSCNILHYRRSLSSQLKFGSGTKTSCDFVAGSASRPEKIIMTHNLNSFPIAEIDKTIQVNEQALAINNSIKWRED